MKPLLKRLKFISRYKQEMSSNGGGTKIIINLFYLVTSLMLIDAILLIVYGSITISKNPYLNTIFGGKLLHDGAVLHIIVGCFSFLITCLGCKAFLQARKGMLLTYIICVSVLFILLLASTIMGLQFSALPDNVLKERMIKSMAPYYTHVYKRNKVDWDAAQIELECCGTEDKYDWMYNSPEGYNPNFVEYPKSCCNHKLSNCLNMNSKPELWKDGCFMRSINIAKKHARHLGGVGICVLIVMVYALACSVILYIKLHRRDV